jgi:hypothetical protein
MSAISKLVVVLCGFSLVACNSQAPPPQNQSAATSQEAMHGSTPKASEILGTPAGTVMTAEYVAAVGRFAYIWGWPLVNNLNRSHGMSSVPAPGRLGGIAPVSPIGHVSMLTDYISADERLVTCPNQDTVYGAGFAHVDAQPVVVQVPDFGNRFFVYQIADARTNAIGNIGKQYGTKPGFYLVVGPN